MPPHPVMFDGSDPILARVRTIALALPEATEKISHGRPTFFSAPKMFAVYGGSQKNPGGPMIRYAHALLIKPTTVNGRLCSRTPGSSSRPTSARTAGWAWTSMPPRSIGRKSPN